MTITQASQKEEGTSTTRRDITRKAPLSERIMKKVASAVLLVGLATAPTNCGLETSGLRIEDGGQTDADADLDADVDLDGDTDHDSGPDADTDHDGGPDLDADTDVDGDTDLDGGPDADSDVDDGGPDADTDVDADAGPIVCMGTFEESITGSPVYVGTPVNIGGYIFENMGESGPGILMDIGCVDDSSTLDSGVYLEEGAAETVIDRPDDGKRIRLRNLSNSAILANMTIVVENL